MKSQSALIFFVISFIFSVPAAARAEKNIEQVQREFQARFNFDTKGNYVIWPPGKCGSPAPLYPPGGFYGDLDSDPEFAAYLVSDLCAQFYGSYVPLYITGDVQFDWNSHDGLWAPLFLKNTTIDGQTVPPPFFSMSDFPKTGSGFDLTAVTTANYENCFYTIRTYIEKLYYASANVGFAPIDPNGYDEGQGGFTSTNGCLDAYNGALSEFNAWAWNPSLDNPIPPIGIRAGGSTGCMSSPPEASVSLEARRGAILVEPTFVGGSVDYYMCVTNCTGCATVGSPTPPVSADGTYHHLTSLGVDGVDQTIGQSIANFPPGNPGCPSNCSTVPDQGWSVGNLFGILSPNFDTTPDSVPLCGDGPSGPGSGTGNGSGGTGNGSCGGSCAPCLIPGSVTANVSETGLDVRIGLGPDQYGNPAGYLRLNTATLTASTYQSSAMDPIVSSDVTLNDNVNPTQITTPNVTAYIVSAGTGYTVYLTNQNLTPAQFVSSVAVSSNYNQISFSEVLGPSGTARVIQFNYTNTAPGTSSWTKVEGSGVRNESRSTVWTTPTNRTDTIVVSASNGAVATQTTEQYQTFPWGEALAQRTIGTGSLAKTTSWTYYQSTDGPTNIGQLKQVIEPTGRWERYTYDFGGRLTNKVSQFEDNAPTTADSANRATVIGYDDADGIITNIQKLLGTEVGRSYLVHSVSGTVKKTQTIQCQVAGAAINSSANLTNTVWQDTNTWQTLQTLNADGTMSFYTYTTNTTTGQKTTTVTAGAPNTGQTAIVDGTQTVTVIGTWGQLLSRTAYDILSGLLIDQQTYTYSDSLNRSYTVTHLDGTSETFNYLCCGLDNQIDRDGVTTQYTYDAAKRLIATTRLGITTSNVLDSAGHTVATVRYGTDSTQVRLNGFTFGNDGSLVAETNALAGITYHGQTTNSVGETVMNDTNADGGIRVTTYFQDGSILGVTNTAVHPLLYLYGLDSDGPYSTEMKVTSSGGTNEWVKTSTDADGRAWKTLYSGGAFSRSYFNNLGQLTNQVDPDGLMTLSLFNAKGEQVYTVSDMNTNGAIDLTSDRITYAIADVTTDFGTTVRRTRTYAWSTNSSSISNLVSMSEVSADGLRSWQTAYRDASTPVVTKSQTIYSTGGNRYVTNTAPDGSYTISSFLNGRLVSTVQKDSLNNQLSSVSYSYDAHGRQGAVSDARNGSTFYSYNSADLVSSVTTPNPGGLGGGAQTTTTYYNPMLQATNVVQPDGTSVISVFLPTGELGTNYGSRTYPVSYTYDYAGRMKTMSTWKNFGGNSGQAVTTWNYDANRGFLSSKTYDGGAPGPSYTYTSAGRLKTRVWARGITTTYAYDNGGSLATIAYSDGTTPNVTNTFDRLGRQATIACNGMTDTLSYNTANQLLSESFSGGTLAGLAVTNAYDAYLRKVALALSNQTSTLVQYGYDNASRLQNVTNGTAKITYAYLANSPLVSQISFTNSGVQRMVTTKSYDFLNRLTSISSAPSAASPISYSYTYNNANQRVRVLLADGSAWQYVYDSLGQVVSGHKFFADGTPVAGQQFDYSFDNIGNRTQTLSGGDQSGLNQRSATYSANNLNQYTNRTVPGFADVMGIALATNTVTVGGQTAYRKAEYFRDQLPVSNSSAAVWTNIAVSSPNQTSITGNVFVAQSTENYSYDGDGNLTGDGRWTYTWDAENRMVSMQGQAGIPTGAKYKLDFLYDSQSRRIQKLVSTNNGTTYIAQNTNRFIYNGWNPVAILTPASSVSESFAWGLDLSGNPQDAGGVGGLLQFSDTSNGSFFAAYDGNGTLIELAKAADGTIGAQYEYGPFGEFIRKTGALAKINAFRFSTKYQDDESDLLCYGYRYLDNSTGKWIGRDPSGERVGPNLYSFVSNDSINSIDLLGLIVICNCPEDYFSSLGLVKGRDYNLFSNQIGFYAAIPGSGFAPQGVEAEIVWDMLRARSRVFKAKGLEVGQLQAHVASRLKALQAIKKVRWGYGHDAGFNTTYWSDPVGTVRSNPAGGVTDMFEGNVSRIFRGCKATSRLILLKGILDTVGPSEFNSAIGVGGWIDTRAMGAHLLLQDQALGSGDWVPGDIGYVQGSNPDRGLTGEWIIYKGGSTWWGFGFGGDGQTLEDWVKAVGSWEGADPEFEPYIDSRRIYSGVGLDWHR